MGSPVSPSTQTERGSPVYPVSPVKSGDSGESGESPRVKVDDRSSDKPLARTVISGNDGRKVTVSVYKIGEVENIEGDKIVRRARLKFVLKYADLVRECTAESGKPYLDCGNALREIAKATHYSVSRKALIDAISELRNKYGKEEAVSLVDYVRKNYPDRLAEIEKDPFKWVLERTKEIVGYERLKLLTFLSLVSSQMERVSGMSRVHIMLVGPSGVGKSSTVKSVLRLIEGTDIYFPSTRLTPNALGYLDVNSFDGKVLFIEQIDKQILNYLREMMTEGGITTYVTEREVDETGRERFVTRRITIPGQAVVITTSVADNIDIDREQLFNRFLKVYVNPKSVDSNKVIEAIWLRKKSEVSEVDKRVFLAYLLSRPKFADTSDLLERAKAILKPIVDLTGESVNRTAEVLRNLTIATAIARGKTKVENEDFEFVLQHFQLDVLYNGLGLSERDIEFVTALPNEGSLKTSEVADKLRVSKQYALNVLKNLERKGVVEGRKEDGKTFSWTLTPLGKRIKSLVNAFNKGVVEVKDEKGGLIAEAKFRPDDNGGGGRGNAVPVNDGGGVPKNEGEDNRVDEAYQHLKRAGWVLVDEFVNWYGEDVLEALKRKDLVTFNEVDGKLYVTAK
jgi:predicted transcriptional regulator/GTPase SAR1 family protein